MSVHGFDRVDAQADAQSLVAYLERARAAVAAQKRLLLELQQVRPGDRLLDIGCGTGEDALALAQLAGPAGRVVGLDSSETMIAEARRRADESPYDVEFRVGDAHALEFADASFDGGRAERVFQHLADPERALGELLRVLRPGGRVVVADPDWETLVVASGDRELTRRICAAICDAVPSATVARALPAMLRSLGAREVEVTPATLVLERYEPAAELVRLDAVLAALATAGAFRAAELERWRDELRARDAAGTFFLAVTGFVTAARKD